MRFLEPQRVSARLIGVMSKRDARPLTRLRSLAAALACVGVLGSGCGSGPPGAGSPADIDPPTAAGQPALPGAQEPPALTALAPTTTERPAPLTMLGRTAFESPAPAPSAECHLPGPILADVPRGFEPPGEGPAPSTTLLIPCTAEQAPPDQARAEHEPTEVVEAPEAPEAAEADLAPSATTPTDGQAGMPVLPPVGDGEGVARWTVEIIEWFPHDPEAFTQGLEIAGGTMYESTGLWGRSSLRAVSPATGEVTARVDLPAKFFRRGPHRGGRRDLPAHLAERHRSRVRPCHPRAAAGAQLHRRGLGALRDGRRAVHDGRL